MAGFKQGMRYRILVFAVAVTFLFCLDGVRVLYLQVIKHDELAAKAESQQLSDTEVKAMRGTIYDSDGNILAQSATVWNIFIDPSNIKTEEKRNTVVNGLAKYLELNEKEKKKLYNDSKKDTKYVVVAKKIENSVKEKIADFSAKERLGNIIGSEQTTRRYYPYDSFASSVLGFCGGDNQGLSGLEAYYNKELAGTNGRIITVKDANSNRLPNDYETSIEAVDGDSLVLTISQPIQYYLEKGLKEALNEYQCKGTYGVVMNCNTGAVLAMSSMPDYDCNDPYKITYSKMKKEIQNENGKKAKAKKESECVQRQWRNFTINDTYVPGSVFKTFMASAALEENVATLDTTYTCTGGIQVDQYYMKCHYHAGHGTQNFTQGLENSCNPFFITVGQKLGAHNYFKYFNAFGFTEKTGIDLPGEAMSQYYPEDQYGVVELSSASFGQTNSLTPIQVCCGLCAIANGGTLLKPYIVSEIRDANGNTVKKTEKKEVRRVLSEDTSEKVRKMMKGVVDEGTGKNGYVAGYRVGGKTGTSTKLGESKPGEKDKYIVSFAAIAPSDKPEIAVLVLVDEPNVDLGGGALCAPIAAQVTEQAMQVLGIEPKYDETEAKDMSTTVPSVIGGTAESTMRTLTSANLHYVVVGNGDKVVDQSPAAGSSIPSGGVVVLITDKSKRQKVAVPDFTGLSISEAKNAAQSKNLNIRIGGNSLTNENVVAYSQSVQKGSKVDAGTVIDVSFKSTVSVLD